MFEQPESLQRAEETPDTTECFLTEVQKEGKPREQEASVGDAGAENSQKAVKPTEEVKRHISQGWSEAVKAAKEKYGKDLPDGVNKLFNEMGNQLANGEIDVTKLQRLINNVQGTPVSKADAPKLQAAIDCFENTIHDTTGIRIFNHEDWLDVREKLPLPSSPDKRTYEYSLHSNGITISNTEKNAGCSVNLSGPPTANFVSTKDKIDVFFGRKKDTILDTTAEGFFRSIYATVGERMMKSK